MSVLPNYKIIKVQSATESPSPYGILVYFDLDAKLQNRKAEDRGDTHQFCNQLPILHLYQYYI